MMEEAINQVKQLLKPFEAGPVEWVRVPMNHRRSVCGLAISAPLVDSACSQKVLIDLISGIAGKLLHAIRDEDLAGVQIAFGRSNGDQIERCYRIMIPADKLTQAMVLKILPHTYDIDPSAIRGFWFGKYERKNQG
jgi:hypothetical protein